MLERIIELTTDLVAIPTHETEAAAQVYLADVLRGSGFTCELQEVGPQRPNLIAQRGSAGPFLCSHVDTHPPHAHPDAFVCRRQGELLVGRGTLDAKGQIAALVTAVEAEGDADALVVITCDEEDGGLGSEHLAFPDGPWHDDGGIVLEPTGFATCTAQAGNIDIRVDVSAPPTHAYADELSPSPVRAVLGVIEELDTCRFMKASHPLLGRPRANVGRLRGGEHRWRTPARASLEMTLGIVPPTDLAEAEAEVRGRLDEIAGRWAGRGASFLYEIVDTSEAIEVEADLAIAKRLSEATGEPLQPAGMRSWTDAGNLLVHHGLPCVVFGAGNLSAAHSDREAVAIGDLVRLATVLRVLLRSA